MRYACLTLVFVLIGSIAFAFEVEDNRLYSNGSTGLPLKILSTADIDVFEPIIEVFQRKNPDFAIQYDVASSTEVMRAIYAENANYDLVISSAMDLQMKLANDGLASPYSSDVTNALPSWAKWRDRVFAFTQEPAVIVVSEKAFSDMAIPENREDLIGLLRDNPDFFDGKIGTYDVRVSGLGYLFATQESRNTEAFWRLSEIIGRLNARLYCCSGQMINAVASGELALAYNVLGSYSRRKLASTPGIRVVEMDDFVSVMLRTAIIPKNAGNPVKAGQMIDFLLGLDKDPILSEKTGLPPLNVSAITDNSQIRPIRLGPGLLVFLDKLRRQNFLRSWESAVVQN